jgi:cytoplasmic tRNA 2-thiolation protein 2
LQEENPSRESTIVRTAGKLIPFQFNRIPEIIDGNVPLATRRRQKRYNLKTNESVSSESFCPLCNSPLAKSEIVDWSNHNNCKSSDTFYTSCCSSCQFQILPPDTTSMEKFYTDLPHSVVARANRVNNGNLNALRWVFVCCRDQSIQYISNLVITRSKPIGNWVYMESFIIVPIQSVFF